jgi:hypothetical protein
VCSLKKVTCRSIPNSSRVKRRPSPPTCPSGWGRFRLADHWCSRRKPGNRRGASQDQAPRYAIRRTSPPCHWSNAVRSRLYFHAKDGAVNENVRTLQGKKANYSEVGGPSALADLSGKWIDSVHGRWKAILIPEGIECFHMTDFENWKKPFDFKLGDGTRDYDRHHRILNGLLNIIGRRIPLEWFAAATPQPVFRREK